MKKQFNQDKKLRNFDKVLKYFGSVKNLSKHLDITTNAIYMWDHVPEKQALKIDKLTEGEIKSQQLYP